MSAIKHALNKLDSSIRRLEASMNGLEESMAGQQRDMFGQPASNQNKSKKNGKANGAVIAQRLDQAIQRVESILKDGTN